VSGIRRCSISGACRGENSRPLNAVTSRSPAVHPACASREIACRRSLDGASGQGLNGVGIAIERVPDRYQPVRLGEQQEQDSINDGQRLIESDRATAVCGPARFERRCQARQRTEHAVTKRPADTRGMRIGIDHARSERPWHGAGHRAGVGQCPQGGDTTRAQEQPREVKLDARAGPRPGAVRDAQRASIGDDRPLRSCGEATPNRVAPCGGGRRRPGQYQQHSVRGSEVSAQAV
jgi:hypothetical protein